MSKVQRDTPSARHRASVYLKIAQEAEAVEARCDLQSDDREKNGVDTFFTCNKVSRDMGYGERSVYTDLMCPDDAEVELWTNNTCMSIRVLMLCFMAAMVEAGDA